MNWNLGLVGLQEAFESWHFFSMDKVVPASFSSRCLIDCEITLYTPLAVACLPLSSRCCICSRQVVLHNTNTCSFFGPYMHNTNTHHPSMCKATIFSDSWCFSFYVGPKLSPMIAKMKITSFSLSTQHWKKAAHLNHPKRKQYTILSEMEPHLFMKL